jgi:hypothetical protein
MEEMSSEGKKWSDGRHLKTGEKLNENDICKNMRFAARTVQNFIKPHIRNT